MTYKIKVKATIKKHKLVLVQSRELVHERAGGKAVNVAYCLVKLGIKVTLFTIADKIGLALLEQTFSSFGNLCIKKGKQGYNTASEFLDEVSKVNLSDIRDNDKFGPKTINSKDLSILFL